MRATMRVARRELLRAKGRSLLVLVMVLLPVAAVVALDTLVRTGDISVEERLPGELGGAEARLEVLGGAIVQDPTGQQVSTTVVGTAPTRSLDAGVRAALDERARLLEVRLGDGHRAVRTADRRTARVSLVGVDLRDPASRGPFRVLDGRVPATPGEVAVSPAVHDFGVGLGDTLDLGGGRLREVVGIVDEGEDSHAVTGLPAAVGMEGAPVRRAYVSGAPVTWEQVRALNRVGVSVLSRSVVLDPPPASDVPLPEGFGEQAAYLAAIVGLVTVIAVLEVVLLAGPAFAVGARRQRRSLALLLSTGGEPRDVRRVVLAQGLLLGVTASVLAVGIGIAAAALLRAPLARWADATWGEFEVSPRTVLLVALLGAGTAVLAAVVPAVLASRQPVVAALQGRRAEGGPSRRTAAAGAVLLVIGFLACYRALGRGFPELWVGAAAVPTVLGAALLAPAVLQLLGRTAGRLPLALRYAVRDADRQRGRTAPAVAAITGVVAGVVALGTAAGSDRDHLAAPLHAAGPRQAVVALYATDVDYRQLAQTARTALPGEPVALVPGLPLAERLGSPSADVVREVVVCRTDAPRPALPDGRCEGFTSDYYGGLGSTVLVGLPALEALAPRLSAASLAAGRAALERGVALVAGAGSGARAELRVLRTDPSGNALAVERRAVVTAEPLVMTSGSPPLAVVPEAVADRLGGAETVGMLVGGSVDEDELSTLAAALRRVDTGAYPYVEASAPDDGTDLVLLLLGLGAGTLVLGGSLAATSLALTEARPDLLTLGQVGARPRTRRLVAGAYSLVLTAVGAVLGCLAGLVPGIAGAIAVNRGSASATTSVEVLLAYGPRALDVVDVPWLLLGGLVLVLPLVTAVVTGLALRTRLGALTRRQPA